MKIGGYDRSKKEWVFPLIDRAFRIAAGIVIRGSREDFFPRCIGGAELNSSKTNRNHLLLMLAQGLFPVAVVVSPSSSELAASPLSRNREGGHSHSSSKF